MNAEVLDALYRIAEHRGFLVEYLDLGAYEVLVVRTDQAVVVAQLFGGHLGFGPDHSVDAADWREER